MPENLPFSHWDRWWLANPFLISLSSGAFAGMSAEAILFPLDCLKTRSQSRQGFAAAGGFRGLYRGCGIAILGSVPGSAIFFCTYEFTKHCLGQTNRHITGHGSGGPDFEWATSLIIASVCGELAAASIRVPVDIVKQRLQAGYTSSFSLPMSRSIFLASFKATAMRDVAHSSLQYPIYEYLKVAAANWACGGNKDLLPVWLAASCGSIAGVVSAIATTPFDLLKTRLNLRTPPASTCASARPLTTWQLLGEEIHHVHQTKGVLGFFAGAGFRAVWMGLGGFVFLGSFEMSKNYLCEAAGAQACRGDQGAARMHQQQHDALAPKVHSAAAPSTSSSSLASAALAPSLLPPPTPPRPLPPLPLPPFADLTAEQHAPTAAFVPSYDPLPPETVGAASSSPLKPLRHQLGAEPSPSVSFTAGLLAGLAVDLPLHPVDTLKTRLQAQDGFAAAGGTRGLWNGLSAVLIMSVPGSAVFFVVYDQMRYFLERHTVTDVSRSSSRTANIQAVWRDAVSASLADISACLVRVPCEVVKQRMQTCTSTAPLSIWSTARQVGAEGAHGFYAGLGATISREVPFALIQMPLFEELKLRHPWAAQARNTGDRGLQGLIGMTCGSVAGAFAGALTTPLDAAKTRIMLTARRDDRASLLTTLKGIHQESGVRGLLCGIVPRTLHCGAGGALWLGAFEWSKLLLTTRSSTGS